MHAFRFAAIPKQLTRSFYVPRRALPSAFWLWLWTAPGCLLPAVIMPVYTHGAVMQATAPSFASPP